MVMVSYDDLIASYTINPRDVQIVPNHTIPIWFHVFVENNKIYVKSPNSYEVNRSGLTEKRPLLKSYFDNMLAAYPFYRNEENIPDQIAKQIKNLQTKSYWYGIFADMGV